MQLCQQHLRDGRARRVRFEVAAAAASTQSPPELHYRVAQLARRPGGAAIGLAALHDCAADARPNEHTDEVLYTARRAKVLFTDCSNIHIVAHRDRQMKPVLQERGQRQVIEGDAYIRAREQEAPLPIDLSRDADADPGYGTVGGELGCVEGILHLCQQTIGEECNAPIGTRPLA